MILSIWFFIRKYIRELLTAGFAVLSVIIGFIYRGHSLSVWLSLSIVFISLLIFIYVKSRERDIYYISFTKRKDKDDWLGKGEFDYDRNNDCFSITNADPGYIYERTLYWSNYKYELEFKIIHSCIGIVVRAINLSNCIMMQIGEGGIRPHIKINGMWKAWESKETNLTYDQQLSLDKWYKCIMLCEQDVIKVKIYDGNHLLFDREWSIPKGALIFMFKTEQQQEISVPFAINLEYGAIGLRNYGEEKGLIRNIIAEKK